jgi:hypothetical protein
MGIHGWFEIRKTIIREALKRSKAMNEAGQKLNAY